MFQMSISSKWPHIQFCSTHLDVLFSYQRHFCRSATMKTRRGAGAHEGKMTKDEINKMIENEKRGIFRKLDIGLPQPFNKERKKINDRIIVKAAPREKQMKPNQDWSSVWPAQRTFQPSVVPLPIRQGYVQLKDQVTPSKYANVELMKIPNFLHLTPPAIKKQCQKLKQFCTPWPDGLETEKDLDVHFPLEEITSDYLNASSSIRDARSRIVTLKFRLSSLNLDYKAQDKFLRLIGKERYCNETDIVTLTSDRCPYRKQNREYCEYLLKALYHESNKTEEWESTLKEDKDSETYQIEDSLKDNINSDSFNHKLSVQEVLNSGENHISLAYYKKNVQKLLGLQSNLPIIPEDA